MPQLLPVLQQQRGLLCKHPRLDLKKRQHSLHLLRSQKNSIRQQNSKAEDPLNFKTATRRQRHASLRQVQPVICRVHVVNKNTGCYIKNQEKTEDPVVYHKEELNNYNRIEKKYEST